MSSSAEPGPRHYFFYFERHSSLYVWGGAGTGELVDDLEYLYQFNYATGAWVRHQLKDQHPPGVCDGCCARIGDCVYFYGGYDESLGKTGSLYELNLTTLTWQELSPPGPGSPSKKSGCKMVHHNNTLVIYGGVTEDCSTNETHIFDIATGTWSSPVTGDVPKLDDIFVFCKVSQNKVVKCGGYDSAIYVLDLSTMHWTIVPQSGPFLGVSPTGTCIGYGSDHAQLLMIGERGVWLLDVATWELKELQDTDLLPGGKDVMRKGHSATKLSSTPTSVDILIFGGELTDEDIGYTFTTSSTTLLILKKYEDDKWWKITDIYERVEYERQFYKRSSTQEEVDLVSTPSQTSQTSPSQSSRASSQAASSKPIPHENMDGKKSPKVPDFSLKKLMLLKWTDGQRQSLELRDEMISKWRDVGVFLDISPSRLDGIFTQRLGDVSQCVQDVLQEWIKNGSSDYPATWEGLLHLLEDLKLNSCAHSLKTALNSF